MAKKKPSLIIKLDKPPKERVPFHKPTRSFEDKRRRAIDRWQDEDFA